MIGVLTPDGNKAIGAVSVLTPDGDKLIGRVSILTPDGDKLIYDSSTAPGGSLTVLGTPSDVTGSAMSESPANVVTAAVTAQAFGGTEPYTFAWALDTGDASWSAGSPAAATTQFIFAGLAAGTSEQATFTVTATDARGRTGVGTVSAYAYNYGGF